MKFRSQKGFSLIELLVVFAIISVLTAVIFSSFAKSRAAGRDAQTIADKQSLKLALARAAEFAPSGKYPGADSTWVCLKTSGSCWRENYSGSSVVNTALTSFLPGGVFPKTQSSVTTEYRYDSYLYNARDSVEIPGYSGPFLIWSQEKPFTNQFPCNGVVKNLDQGIYYCYEKLQ